ncbi:hypothetical protein [Streptoalloteichus tenebrarius]|nr:hypothetical protein [Streptoalloteichus tenebrarius]
MLTIPTNVPIAVTATSGVAGAVHDEHERAVPGANRKTRTATSAPV